MSHGETNWIDKLINVKMVKGFPMLTYKEYSLILFVIITIGPYD